jgi:hypothetical protein
VGPAALDFSVHINREQVGYNRFHPFAFLHRILQELQGPHRLHVLTAVIAVLQDTLPGLQAHGSQQLREAMLFSADHDPSDPFHQAHQAEPREDRGRGVLQRQPARPQLCRLDPDAPPCGGPVASLLTQ